ncbi:MAG: WD40 repeat domain-containing protein [Candidatus Heimdallarchaeota archaeon]|nr:MAG: WD40 repeat domain-containing protein [Candidatus Heimdallarchaeota archaeon]
MLTQERGILVLLLLPVIIIPNISCIFGGSKTYESFHQEVKFIPQQPEIFQDISLVNPDSGTAFSHLIGQPGSIHSVVFSPDERIVASGSTDGNIKLWDVITGDELPLDLTGHRKTVNSLAFSPDGTILASGSGDSYICLWDVSTGKLIQNLSGHTKAVYSVVFSSDGATLISGSLDTTIKLWNVTSGEEWPFLLEHPTPVFSVAVSPNRKILASGGGDGTIYLWNSTSGKRLLDLTESTDDVVSVVFSPDGTFLASGSAVGVITLWDITAEGTHPSVLTESEEQIFSLAFSPIRKVIASSSENGVIHLWNATFGGGESLLDLIEPGGAVFSVTFSPDGTILASGGADGVIRLWNVVFEDEIQTLLGHEEGVMSVDFSLNGTLASGSADNTIKLWNVSTGRVTQNLTGHTDDVLTVTFSPNGTLLASGSADNTIRLWNMKTGNVSQVTPGHLEDVLTVSFSPNNTILASGCADGTIKLWNINTRTWKGLLGYVSSVESVVFSPNGSLLAAGSSADTNITLWNLDSGTSKELSGHISPVKSVVYSPNGSLLASGGVDGSLKLWSIDKGEAMWRDLIGHETSVRSVTFSPNGSLLASAAADGSIKLWNATTGALIQILIGKSDGIQSIIFSPDGKLLASGNINRTIQLWPVDSIQFDTDVDGMRDSWELQYGLNPTVFFDKFKDNDNDGLINCLEFFQKTDPLNYDSDGDSLPDGWEYLGGLDPTISNPNSDNDMDGLPAYYEYQMGLNPWINDAAFDKDNDSLNNLQEYQFGSWANQTDSDLDGMPDWWEFKYTDNSYSFNPRNESDATDDPDGDWVNNFDEFNGGSNPRDFWSSPHFAFSASFAIRIMILLIITVLGILIYMNSRRRTQKALITHFKAPDYPTALKIRKSNYKDYTAFLRAGEDAKKLISLGNSVYFQGNFSEAFKHYDQALTIFERLDNPSLIAETVFKIVWVKKENQPLTAKSSILERFPEQPYRLSIVNAFNQMVQALIAETEKRWEAAEKLWIAALQTEGLGVEYQLLCEGALVRSEFRNWLINPVDPIKERMKSRLMEWQKASENHQFFDMMCEAYLLHARIAIASFQFEEVEEWLSLCSTTAATAGLTIYLNKVDSEFEAFLQHKQRVFHLLKEEKTLSQEEQIKIIQSYLRKVQQIVKDEENES